MWPKGTFFFFKNSPAILNNSRLNPCRCTFFWLSPHHKDWSADKLHSCKNIYIIHFPFSRCMSNHEGERTEIKLKWKRSNPWAHRATTEVHLSDFRVWCIHASSCILYKRVFMHSCVRLYLWVRWWICSWREVPGRQVLHSQTPVHCGHNPWQREIKILNLQRKSMVTHYIRLMHSLAVKCLALQVN